MSRSAAGKQAGTHLDKLIDLLGKQRLVEGMVQNQPMAHREIVETLLQRQHREELRKLIAGLGPEQLSTLLPALPAAEARALWPLLDGECRNEMMWDMPPSLRTIVGEVDNARERVVGQINAYELHDGKLQRVEIGCRRDLDGLTPIWVDLLGASKGELRAIGRYYGLQLPDPDEASDLEASARFYVDDNDELLLLSNFLLDRGAETRSVPVAFALHNSILFTVRSEELPVFRLQRLRAMKQAGYVGDGKDVALDLYGADIEYSADVLEEVYGALGEVGRKLLGERMSDGEASAVLAEIAAQEQINSLIRGNIHDTRRMVSLLLRGRFLTPGQVADANEILRDIDSLGSHTVFLFEKINFLMDTTVGFININQNRRISVLTTVSVVLMPLNVLVGIGGMSEFSMMTEGIPWPLAFGAFCLTLVPLAWLTWRLLSLFERNRGRRVARKDL